MRDDEAHAGRVQPPPTAQTFFFGLSGWPDHPQRPGGGFGHPHTADMGWLATPISSPTFYFYFYFYFYF
jgi:hypothetical protein